MSRKSEELLASISVRALLIADSALTCCMMAFFMSAEDTEPADEESEEKGLEIAIVGGEVVKI